VSFEPAEQHPAENVARGTLFALVAVPVGVIVWVILWNLGVIASIVGFGVAYAAMFLYRFGSGGVLSRTGALRVALVTIGTLILAFFAGVVSDGLSLWSDITGDTAMTGIVSPDFWSFLQVALAQPGVVSGYLPDFGLALLFGAIGCFGLLRSAFRSTKTAAPTPPTNFAPPAFTSSSFGAPAVPPVPTPIADAPADATPQAPVAPPAPPAPPAQPGRFDEFRDPGFKG
jgi:hypothetical protein